MYKLINWGIKRSKLKIVTGNMSHYKYLLLPNQMGIGSLVDDRAILDNVERLRLGKLPPPVVSEKIFRKLKENYQLNRENINL